MFFSLRFEPDFDGESSQVKRPFHFASIGQDRARRGANPIARFETLHEIGELKDSGRRIF